MKQRTIARIRRSSARRSTLEALESRRLMAAEVQLATTEASDNREAQSPPDSPILPAVSEPVEKNATALRETRDWRIDSALIGGVVGGVLGAAAARPTSDASTQPAKPRLYPRGPSAPPTSAVPHPIGLFPDGSVQTIHPDIDPRVLRLLQQGDRAPIPWTTHRPGVGYGAPTNTLAGIDPRLRVLIGMPMNWSEGVGPLLYSRFAITIRPNSQTFGRAQIQQWLTTFEHFSDGNIAQATVVAASPLDPAELADHRYVVFHPRVLTETHPFDALYGMLNTAQRLVNPPDVAVRLFTPPDQSFLLGITLGNHMLVGARRWHVYELPHGDLRVETDAWVRCNGELNQVALRHGGREMMHIVWCRYLANIGRAATEQGGSWRFTDAHSSLHTNIQTNPFRVLASRHKWVPMVFPEAPSYLPQ